MSNFIGWGRSKSVDQLTWYGNELGYVSTLIKHVEKVASLTDGASAAESPAIPEPAPTPTQ